MSGLHSPLAGRAGDLMRGEDATQVTVAEVRHSRFHLVHRDEVDADRHVRPGLCGKRAYRIVAETTHKEALNAWSMSSRRSSMCSRPIESRIVSGATPTTASASGDS